MCHFEKTTFGCGHLSMHRIAHCHFARNDPLHVCSGVQVMKNERWEQHEPCDSCRQQQLQLQAQQQISQMNELSQVGQMNQMRQEGAQVQQGGAPPHGQQYVGQFGTNQYAEYQGGMGGFGQG